VGGNIVVGDGTDELMLVECARGSGRAVRKAKCSTSGVCGDGSDERMLVEGTCELSRAVSKENCFISGVGGDGYRTVGR